MALGDKLIVWLCARLPDSVYKSSRIPYQTRGTSRGTRRDARVWFLGPISRERERGGGQRATAEATYQLWRPSAVAPPDARSAIRPAGAMVPPKGLRPPVAAAPRTSWCAQSQCCTPHNRDSGWQRRKSMPARLSGAGSVLQCLAARSCTGNRSPACSGQRAYSRGLWVRGRWQPPSQILGGRPRSVAASGRDWARVPSTRRAHAAAHCGLTTRVLPAADRPLGNSVGAIEWPLAARGTSGLGRLWPVGRVPSPPRNKPRPPARGLGTQRSASRRRPGSGQLPG